MRDGDKDFGVTFELLDPAPPETPRLAHFWANNFPSCLMSGYILCHQRKLLFNTKNEHSKVTANLHVSSWTDGFIDKHYS